jgi:hypothetical protein
MTTATGSHFSQYHRAWSDLTPPLRPPGEAVAEIARALGVPDGPTLLLGVTPELADIAPDLVAVDRHHGMLVHIWPGDTRSRRALLGDWRTLAFAPAAFAACVGDGSFIAARYPEEYGELFVELARVLRSGARLVLRCYMRPDGDAPVSALGESAGAFRSFHAFKLKLGMALASERRNPNVPVQVMFDTFNRMFPDRAALVRLTGWERGQIDTIDFYEGSATSYSFPSRREWLASIPADWSAVHLVPSGHYELAECCPLLTMRRR